MVSNSCMCQCVAVCCSVLQCVTVRCGALRCVAVRCSALQGGAVRCSVLQCIAVRCSVAVRCIEVSWRQTTVRYDLTNTPVTHSHELNLTHS